MSTRRPGSVGRVAGSSAPAWQDHVELVDLHLRGIASIARLEQAGWDVVVQRGVKGGLYVDVLRASVYVSDVTWLAMALWIAEARRLGHGDRSLEALRSAYDVAVFRADVAGIYNEGLLELSRSCGVRRPPGVVAVPAWGQPFRVARVAPWLLDASVHPPSDVRAA